MKHSCIIVSNNVYKTSSVFASRLGFQHLYLIYPHHHQSLNREGRWGTTDAFAISFLHLNLLSTALWDLPNSRPVHSLMLSSHLFLCPPCLLSPFTVPCKMVLARFIQFYPQTHVTHTQLSLQQSFVDTNYMKWEGKPGGGGGLGVSEKGERKKDQWKVVRYVFAEVVHD